MSGEEGRSEFESAREKKMDRTVEFCGGCKMDEKI